jgi:hypothetical protein
VLVEEFAKAVGTARPTAVRTAWPQVRAPWHGAAPHASEAVLSRQIDDPEPQLTRHGYDVKSIAEEFRIKPADVRLFLEGQLDPGRTCELTEQMLVAGLPA